jgi:type IV pilus assembly protein PilA
MRVREGRVNETPRGFSLIELLIVVAIILIIAAIAIPSLLRSRIAADQASAIASLRVINTSEVNYVSSYGQGYSSTLVQLGPPVGATAVNSQAAGMMDSVLAGGLKSGYSFNYVPANPDVNGNYTTFGVTASPIQVGTTGTSYYYTDQTYVIRGNTTGTASAADSPVAQ